MKLTLDEKVQSTIKSIQSLIAAGWDRNEAIQNQQKLWNLSNKRMQEVESAIPV
jgi:hypothetical protein